MNHLTENIFPIHDQLLPRSAREELLGQRGMVLWLTGLSGSGKSALARGLEHQLHLSGKLAYVIDGDNLRSGLNSDLGFSQEARMENIRRVAEVSKLFVDAGIICINCFVSPTEDIRATARQIIGADDYVEIFVDAPIEVCEQRDVKGLYKRARAGEIKGFTGIDAPFEAPANPDLIVPTADATPSESVSVLWNYVKQRLASPHP